MSGLLFIKKRGNMFRIVIFRERRCLLMRTEGRVAGLCVQLMDEEELEGLCL